MDPWTLTTAARDALFARAESDYPEETCGFVFGAADGSQLVHPMRNLQNQMHAKHPETFRRDARTAYYLDPTEMQRVLREKEVSGEPFLAIYHSHPDHDAYFSETDSEAASPFGEPAFPGVVYIVISVRERRAVDIKAFDWSKDEARFVERPLTIS